jgi:VWFA-related protein
MTRRVINASILLACVVICIHAQSGRQPQPSSKSKPSTSEPQKPRDDVVVVDTELVVLDARVLNNNTGRFVGGLTRDDFEIYEEGKRQEITHFSEDTPPLSIVFLIDMTTIATRDVFNKISQNLEPILRHLRPEDQAALMVVAVDDSVPKSDDWSVWLVHDFTRDKKLLASSSTASVLQFRKPTVAPTFSHLATKHQAIYHAELLLREIPSSENRRVIVALTDDLPLWTRRRFRNTNILRGNGNETIAKKDLAKRLLTSGTMLCALVSPDLELGPKAKAVAKELESSQVSKVLSVFNGYNDVEFAAMAYYAEPTGGEILLATADNAAIQFGDLIDHLYVRYSFGYVSSNRKRDGKFRRISLRVKERVESREGGVRVATKSGYYPPTKDKKSATDRNRGL